MLASRLQKRPPPVNWLASGPILAVGLLINKGLCLDRNWRGTGAGDIAQRGAVRHLRSKHSLVSELPQENVGAACMSQ